MEVRNLSPELIGYHGSPGFPGDFDLLQSYLGEILIKANPRKGYPTSWSNDTSSRNRAEDKTVVFMGYSWGGVDCLLEASVQMDPVLGVILISPYLFLKSTPGLITQTLLQTPGIGDWILKKIAEKKIHQFLEKSCYPKPVPPQYKRVSRTLMLPGVLRQAVLEKRTLKKQVMTAVKKISNASIPIGVVWGRQDQTSSEIDQMEPLRYYVPLTLEKCIESAGHAIPWTHPKELALAIRELLQKFAEYTRQEKN